VVLVNLSLFFSKRSITFTFRLHSFSFWAVHYHHLPRPKGT
jgi:hypothetical protein